MEDDGTTLTSSPSSSSSSSQWKYDVFLSFSGKDTRTGFTDHLYSCLIEKGLMTFRDDPKLEKGKSIAPELFKAIGESWCSIIVFSKAYVFSSWRLDELVEILKQQKERGHKIYPVFYDVEPSELWKPKGSVEDAFTEHEKSNQGKTKRWQDALFEAYCITGWVAKDRYESELIRDIIRVISEELCQTYLNVRNDLIGIKSHLVELRDKICFKKDDVCIVGIWGMDGIGKTTLARVVYNQMSGYFEGKCLLASVREVAMKSGLVSLQKQLLSVLLPGQDFQFFNVEDGTEIIRRRLRHKRVLVVIDDVDSTQHFKCLAEKRDCFGLGSRIIITSRDEHLLLKAYEVDAVYKPTTLDDSEALRLLSLKAFKSDTPEDDFMPLSRSVVKYAGGLPLALEVLGSFLCGRSAAEWRSAIERLKSEPEEEIHSRLTISFDGLKETEKNIFLDIAHFFKRWDRDIVTNILDGCGYHPDIALCVLIDRSLITVENNKIWMHDLLQEMGRKIVWQKFPHEPGKRCRLLEESDVYHVLTQNSGTQAIEGMAINNIKREQNETFTLSADAFLKMKKLRLVIVRGLLKSCDRIYLSNELRLFDWPGYLLESLPLGFQPDNLVVLLLPYSSVKRLWNRDRPLNKLKVVDLQSSPNLIETPDFTMTKNLESLNLEGCSSFVDVHPSIAFLSKLKLLNLRNCKSHRSLPMKIRMESLKTLILSGCLNLQAFPEIAGKMERLLEVYLDGTGIKELPSSVGHLSSRQVLNLSNRMLLKKSPNSMALTLSRLSSLSSLTELNISGRNLGDGDMPSDICCLSSLETLILSNNNFVSLPANLCQLSKLHLLELAECDTLKSLPELSSSINAVGLDGCTSLEIVPNPTKAYNASNGTHYYGVNCFNLAGNALRMLK